MCGRYRLSRRKQLVEEYFESSSDEEDWNPRYNIAPTQPVAAIRQAGTSRILSMMRWGLVPSWASDISIGGRLINGRSETVLEKPAFRDSFRLRRCLVPADGFYEWVRHEVACVICPASTTRPDLPSHWQYPTRYGVSETNRLKALGQCIPPSSRSGYRNREGPVFLPASRRIGARVSGMVSRCEPL